MPSPSRIALLVILAYECVSALLGGILLAAAPDGRLMQMPVSMMRGAFASFLIPGLILTALGVLQGVAFVAVVARLRTAWLFAGLATVGMVVWFAVEIAILRAVVWEHVVWGVPALASALLTIPLLPRGPQRPKKASKRSSV